MFTIENNRNIQKIFTLWLILGVFALAFSGIYSFFPYALRTPSLAGWLNMKNFFGVSLMIHVNLGVLVWFLSIASMLTSFLIRKNLAFIAYIAFTLSALGTVLIVISPFIGKAEPIKNDYVPILHNFTFILGLSLFLCGVMVHFILGLLNFELKGMNLFRLFLYINILIFFVAVLCFVKAAYELKLLLDQRPVNMFEYYELLFWGSGHILQFNYSQLIIIAWFILAYELDKNLIAPLKLFSYLQYGNFLLVISALIIYWIYPIDSFELNNFFTLHMRYVGGILIAINAIWVFFKVPKNFKNFEFIGICCSILLILSGGIIGYLITGANVTIPAHYHGVILGITVGLMSLCYSFLPKLGYKAIKNTSAIWQLSLYTIGQLIHIVALAISGGYGALRKDPGAALSAKAKIFMGLMGIGGTIALIGGILFVVLIFKTIIEKRNEY